MKANDLWYISYAHHLPLSLSLVRLTNFYQRLLIIFSNKYMIWTFISMGLISIRGDPQKTTISYLPWYFHLLVISRFRIWFVILIILVYRLSPLVTLAKVQPKINNRLSFQQWQKKIRQHWLWCHVNLY